MSNLPPIEVPQGAIRLNTDSQKLEFYAQDRWYEMANDSPNLDGGSRGIWGGGNANPGPIHADIEYITIEHLRLMILSDFDVKDFLKSNGINVNSFKSSVEDYIQDTTPRKSDPNKSPQPTLGFQRVLQRAVFHVQSSGKGVVKPINILVAIFSEKESHSVYLLTKAGISRLDIVSYISHGKTASKKESDSVIDGVDEEEVITESGESKFLINLNEQASEGKIDALIGRQEEISRLIQILARRTKNNPLLVGESGVGLSLIHI